MVCFSCEVQNLYLSLLNLPFLDLCLSTTFVRESEARAGFSRAIPSPRFCLVATLCPCHCMHTKPLTSAHVSVTIFSIEMLNKGIAQFGRWCVRS